MWACMRCVVLREGVVRVSPSDIKKDIPHLRAARVHMRVRACVVLC